MNNDHIPLLDAALGVFLRYGFKRATMGDIAKAAGLSRQSLYARFANKDDVFAAGMELYAGRTCAALTEAWATTQDLSDQLDTFWRVSLLPSFEMLRAHPDASDMIEGTHTPAGHAAAANVTQQKVGLLAGLFAPHAPALARHGQTPEQLARFVEGSAMHMLKASADLAEFEQSFATLKASVLALTTP